LALFAQRLERTELIEGVERHTLDVFGERVIFGQDVGGPIPHDAGHWCGLDQALLLHQQRKRLIAPTAGGDLEHTGLGAIGVDHGANIEALEQAAPGDVLGQLLDRNPGLHAPDVRLAEHQLVEGDVARGRQGDFLNCVRHGDSLRDGRREPLSRPQPVTKIPTLL